MIIKSLELKNFRNYDQLQLALDAKTNILFGDNAQGKTNILEAAYVSATTKSHRGTKDREMIRFGEEEAHIRTVVSKRGQDFQLDVHLKKNRTKGIAVNQRPIKKAAELFGILNIVFFSPEDLNIIKDGPAQRRRFLDLELCQLDKIYLSDLSAYHQVLKQRNALLKELFFRPELSDTLAVWDEQLVAYGSRIIARRRAFIEELHGLMQDIHSRLSGKRELLTLSYEPNVDNLSFQDTLFQALERDKRLCQTSVGPHRDDFSFLLGDIDIRRFGSQGQQRTAALSLKLSEIALVRQTIGDTPVLLLDDVLSELDSKRQNYLLNSIHDIQTIITCTGLDEFVKNKFQIHRIFQVTDGTVARFTPEF